MNHSDQQDEYQEFQEEHQEIKKDLKKVIAGNLIFFALLVSLYFLNQEIGFLDKLTNLF